MKSKNILMIVVKNTSELDFSFPLIVHLKQNFREVNISILYCGLSLRQYHRAGKFYSEHCKNIGIKEYDLLSSLSVPFMEKVLRKLLRLPYSDRGISFFFRNIRQRKLEYFFQYKIIKDFFKFLRNILLFAIEKISFRAVDLGSLISQLNPQIVLMGNRTITNFEGRYELFNFLYENKVPVELIPHSTHEVHAFEDFISFDEKGEKLPGFCRFWYSMKYETPWEKYKLDKDMFYEAGYPGLDINWKNHLLSTNENIVGTENVALVVLRKFYDVDEKIPIDNRDQFTLPYREMHAYLSTIKNSLSKLGDFKIIFKPHPSNDFTRLNDLFDDVGIKKYSLSYEPIYKSSLEVSFVISMFSTVLIVPASWGIPVVIYNNYLQSYVHNRWDVMKRLYGDFEFFCNNPKDELTKYIEMALESNGKKRIEPTRDQRHIYKFFKDEPIRPLANYVLSRIQILE